MRIVGVVETIMSGIRELVRSETVVGAPIRTRDAVIVPVSRVAFGLGACGGLQRRMAGSGGMGTGGGGSVEPVAFVVVSKGKARLLPFGSRDATVVNAAEHGASIAVAVIRFLIKRRFKRSRKK